MHTRLFSFTVDFAKSRVKFGMVPAWLIWHHIGVYCVGLVVDLVLVPETPLQILVGLISLQSTNNSWTKKYLSTALYWGNILVGIVAGRYYVLLKVEDPLFARTSLMSALLAAYTGAGLLAIQSFRTFCVS